MPPRRTSLTLPAVLCPERPLVAAAVRRLTGRGWVGFETLEREAAALRTEIAANEAVWPPAALEDRSVFRRGARSAAKAVDPTSGFVAAQLPSMRAVVAESLGAAAALPEWTPLMRQRLAEALTTTYHGLLMWRSHSRRVWVIDPDFAKRLAWAELPSIAGDDVEAPLPALYVMLPKGITMPDPVAAGARHDVEGALVVMDSGEVDGDRRRELRITLFASRARARAHHAQRALGADVTLTATVCLDGDKLPRVARAADEQLDGVWVPPAVAGLAPSSVDTRVRPEPGGVGHLVFALLCFAMEHANDVVRLRPRRSASAHANGRVPLGQTERRIGVFVVGRRYASDHPDGSRSRGTPLHFPLLVAGHYRLVPYGPGGRKRRRRRIKPYRKGPGAERLKATTQRLGGAARSPTRQT